MRRTLVALAALTMLAGCSGESGTPSADASPSIATSTPTPNTAPTQSGQVGTCTTSPPALGAAIILGAHPGASMHVVSSAVVESPDFDSVYYVAVRFKVSGAAEQTGVWVTSSLSPGDGEGSILSADAVAQQATIWPTSEPNGAQLDPSDPNIAAAKACL